MLFTVFTPTYNRAHLLCDAYQSLLDQTCKDFEWLVVDDESTDDTIALIREWQQYAAFPIRLIKQKRGGKHRAHNNAVRHAEGDLFCVLDSDDTLTPGALERLTFHWCAIPDSNRRSYSGVTGLCRDKNTLRIIGTAFPRDVLDCRHYETETLHRVHGEKWGCHRTDVLRSQTYPEIPGELYCPEGVVWNRIAKSYLVRHVNEVLRNYNPQPDGLAASFRSLLMRSPNGARIHYGEYLNLEVPSRTKLRRAVNYIRYSLHAGMSTDFAIRQSPCPIVTTAASIPGWLCYQADLAKYGKPSPSGSYVVTA